MCIGRRLTLAPHPMNIPHPRLTVMFCRPFPLRATIELRNQPLTQLTLKT